MKTQNIQISASDSNHFNRLKSGPAIIKSITVNLVKGKKPEPKEEDEE